MERLFFFASDLLQKVVHYILLSFLPFLCLNGILLSNFLLKSLFFKPKFVENRNQNFAIDPSQHSTDHNPNNVEACCESHGPHGPAGSLPRNEFGSLRSALSARLEQLYNVQSNDSIEYILPSKDQIKFEEKIGSGFVGVFFKVNVTQPEVLDRLSRRRPKGPLCAKLVDMKSLLQIIEDLNYVPGTLSAKIRMTSLFKVDAVGSAFVGKYLAHYHQFLDLVTKLELPSSKPQSRHRHPNVLFYEQVFIYDGKCSNPQMCQKKSFRSLAHAERQQLPALVLFIMEQAKMNLRTAIINEWHRVHSITMAVEWGREIGKGLEYLHQIGFAHLDIKPENILLFELAPGEPVDAETPLHARYIVKIGDSATALLLPTASKVLSQSHETSLYELSPPFTDKFSPKLDTEHFDIHCYAMVLLLMLVGYEHFDRWFMLPQFPTGLLSPARYHLMEAIEATNRQDVPETFVQMFKRIFDRNATERISVKQLLHSDAFKADP